MERIENAETWIPEQEIRTYFCRRKSHCRNRIKREFLTDTNENMKGEAIERLGKENADL